MRRTRFPSDSPRMVTRPGVNRNSMALCVISIQLGIASGRQFTNRPLGLPASSAFISLATWAAAAGFQGMGSVLIRASWSDKLGVQTPLQSGNFARAAQSPACGGGLITGSGAPGAAATPVAAAARPIDISPIDVNLVDISKARIETRMAESLT